MKEDDKKKPLWHIYRFALNKLREEYFKKPTSAFKIQRRYMRTQLSIGQLSVDVEPLSPAHSPLGSFWLVLNHCLRYFPRYDGSKPKMFLSIAFWKFTK